MGAELDGAGPKEEGLSVRSGEGGARGRWEPGVQDRVPPGEGDSSKGVLGQSEDRKWGGAGRAKSAGSQMR